MDNILDDMRTTIVEVNKGGGTRPCFIMNLGSQGSGKSTTAARIITREHGLPGVIPPNLTAENTIIVDVDKLTKTYTNNARHIEDSERAYAEGRAKYGDPMSDVVMVSAIANRSNIIWESTGQSLPWIVHEAERMQRAGYTVVAFLTTAGPPESINQRLAARKHTTGQAFVPVTQEILDTIGANFVRLGQHVDTLCLLDNTGPSGTLSRIIGVVEMQYGGRNEDGRTSSGLVAKLTGGVLATYDAAGDDIYMAAGPALAKFLHGLRPRVMVPVGCSNAACAEPARLQTASGRLETYCSRACQAATYL